MTGNKVELDWTEICYEGSRFIPIKRITSDKPPNYFCWVVEKTVTHKCTCRRLSSVLIRSPKSSVILAWQRWWRWRWLKLLSQQEKNTLGTLRYQFTYSYIKVLAVVVHINKYARITCYFSRGLSLSNFHLLLSPL